ncbi:MAG TPA: DeoR family transcriptional regulator [Candidatus Binatia bacterium]|jgi:transcriptional regulator of heat shock response|nr:DeoR family transcriptional regulator [Candidatus Binatia bacterium]
MPNDPDNRLRDIFRIIVREYLRSAEPIGSAYIVSRHRLGVSPATVRNDMAELEERGLLEQPHTSAGRIPTEAGYRYYVDEFVRDGELEDKPRRELEAAVVEMERDMESAARKFARTVASITGETAIIRVGTQSYLTGVQNLMGKPEFREGELMREALRAVDELDALVGDLESRASEDVSVLIGADNPFGRELSSVFTVFAAPDAGEAVIGILGPTRMDYDTNVALLRYIRERLDELDA